MTNQEINQLYWSLDPHLRALFDAAINAGLTRDAARAMMDLCELKFCVSFSEREAVEWAKWRERIANSTRKD